MAKVVVLGAGVAGHTAASFLSMNKYSNLLYFKLLQV